MRVPVIKDGVVVNVIEMAPDTTAVTKAEHKDAMARERVEYEARAADWRKGVEAGRSVVKLAKQDLFMARGLERAARSGVAKSDLTGDAGAHAARQLLTLGNEAAAHQDNVERLEAAPLPPRPRLERARRWIVPEGCIVGPPGGEIGDTWDGVAYTKTRKVSKDGGQVGKSDNVV
jgi:hypothetical protein